MRRADQHVSQVIQLESDRLFAAVRKFEANGDLRDHSDDELAVLSRLSPEQHRDLVVAEVRHRRSA